MISLKTIKPVNKKVETLPDGFDKIRDIVIPAKAGGCCNCF